MNTRTHTGTHVYTRGCVGPQPVTSTPQEFSCHVGLRSGRVRRGRGQHTVDPDGVQYGLRVRFRRRRSVSCFRRSRVWDMGSPFLESLGITRSRTWRGGPRSLNTLRVRGFRVAGHRYTYLTRVHVRSRPLRGPARSVCTSTV